MKNGLGARFHPHVEQSCRRDGWHLLIVGKVVSSVEVMYSVDNAVISEVMIEIYQTKHRKIVLL